MGWKYSENNLEIKFSSRSISAEKQAVTIFEKIRILMKIFVLEIFDVKVYPSSIKREMQFLI